MQWGGQRLSRPGAVLEGALHTGKLDWESLFVVYQKPVDEAENGRMQNREMQQIHFSDLAETQRANYGGFCVLSTRLMCASTIEHHIAHISFPVFPPPQFHPVVPRSSNNYGQH